MILPFQLSGWAVLPNWKLLGAVCVLLFEGACSPDERSVEVIPADELANDTADNTTEVTEETRQTEDTRLESLEPAAAELMPELSPSEEIESLFDTEGVLSELRCDPAFGSGCGTSQDCDVLAGGTLDTWTGADCAAECEEYGSNCPPCLAEQLGFTESCSTCMATWLACVRDEDNCSVLCAEELGDSLCQVCVALVDCDTALQQCSSPS